MRLGSATTWLQGPVYEKPFNSRVFFIQAVEPGRKVILDKTRVPESRIGLPNSHDPGVGAGEGSARPEAARKKNLLNKTHTR